METKIQYGARELKVLKTYDTVIVGGGSAGSSAGYTSAKNGFSTLIIDKAIRLGGSATNALVTPMMRSFTNHHQNFYDLENEMKKYGETRDQHGTAQRWFSAEAMADAWESLYTSCGGELLYDASVCDVILEEQKIKYVIANTIEGLVAIGGRQFVDASGDAVLSRLSGVEVLCGDEEGNNQITSLRFEVGGIDIEKYREYVFSLDDTYSIHRIKGDQFESAMVAGKNFAMEPLFRKGVEAGILIPQDLHYFQNFTIPDKTGVMSFNCPHLVDLKNNTHALERSAAIVYGHQCIRRLVRFLKEMMPGFENCYLVQVANMLGVRESWQIVGKLLMHEEDYPRKARYEDAVARGDWYIDVHSANKSLVHQISYQPGDYYEIPYRAMVTNEVENLVVAGRCISTTFLMQASVRIIPTCIDMGEAVGMATILANQTDIPLNALNGKDIAEKLGEYR